MRRVTLLLTFILAGTLAAQVYSPSVLLKDQPDSTDLKRFTEAIYRNANAKTARERAEAIWRFFLTDGRFVRPGFWYHIAGWAYEEPTGEVLDPIKLLNSYGFGLCYHIAPLLEAVFEAGGFEDARVWFLTGHTVAEVYYDGAWHYFDSDMMGYNVAGDGPFRGKPVVSVRQLERDPSIILGKMSGPKSVRPGVVDTPWYPADVRAGAMKGLASLFTTTDDNFLFPYTRYSLGHDMSYVLRPGEKLIHYFAPEEPTLYYLPYVFDGRAWSEFPREIARYKIRTMDGPRSQKDNRLWGTGRIEYTPPEIGSERVLQFDMPSPWVIIDAHFLVRLNLPSQNDSVVVETSVDGEEWKLAGEQTGPYEGEWNVEPATIVRSANGRLTAVTGHYGYKVRITRRGNVPIHALKLVTRFQLNPRTLPALQPGSNELVYRSGLQQERVALRPALRRLASDGLELVEEQGQEMLRPKDGGGETVIELSAGGKSLLGFDAGARFIHVTGGLAPDKLTAETRRTSVRTKPGTTSIEWALSRSGPWRTLWTYPTKPEWRDNDPIDRVLNWPEAFASVRELPQGVKSVYVRFRSTGPCLDNVRLAALTAGPTPKGRLKITHTWREQGSVRQHHELVDASTKEYSYVIWTGQDVHNESVTFESVP